MLSVGADLEACIDDTGRCDGTHCCGGGEDGFVPDDNRDEGDEKSEIRPDENEDERLCLDSERVLRWFGSSDAVISILPPPMMERFNRLDLSEFSAHS